MPSQQKRDFRFWQPNDGDWARWALRLVRALETGIGVAKASNSFYDPESKLGQMLTEFVIEAEAALKDD